MFPLNILVCLLCWCRKHTHAHFALSNVGPVDYNAGLRGAEPPIDFLCSFIHTANISGATVGKVLGITRELKPDL